METEEQVRAMRDQAYEKPSTDKNWEGCKKNWMQPSEIAWLREITKKHE